MKKIVSLFIVVVLLFPVVGFGYSECLRPVKKVWNQTKTNASPDQETVWIAFSDGGSPVYKKREQISEGQMARFYAQALTAITSGKKLLVRYPENGLSCPPVGSARNDILGMWITAD